MELDRPLRVEWISLDLVVVSSACNGFDWIDWIGETVRDVSGSQWYGEESLGKSDGRVLVDWIGLDERLVACVVCLR